MTSSKMLVIVLFTFLSLVSNTPLPFISDGAPPLQPSGTGGTSSFTNPGRTCSNTSPCKRTNRDGQSFCCEATLRNRSPSCRRVKNCKRLSSDSVDQGTGGTCMTTSGASANKPCIFPFKFRGVG